MKIVVHEVNVVQFIFLVIVMLEDDPEQQTRNETCNGQTGKCPHKLGVGGSWRKCNTEGGSDSVRKQEQGHDERFHAGWRFGVGIFQTGDGGQNLRHTNQKVSWSLDRHMHTVRHVSVFWSTAHRVVITWASFVNVMLQDRSINHGSSTKHETPEDLGDGSERSESSNEWVDKSFTDWNEHNNGDGINTLQDIVWQAVQLHLTGLGNEIVQHLAVHNPVDWEKDKHFTSVNRSSDFFNELVSPWVLFFTGTGLGCVVVEFVLDGNPGTLERSGNHLFGNWHLDVLVSTKVQSQQGNDKETERQQVSSPEVDVSLVAITDKEPMLIMR